MEHYMDTSTTRSIFKDGSKTTTERYTAAWIKLINLLERNKR